MRRNTLAATALVGALAAAAGCGAGQHSAAPGRLSTDPAQAVSSSFQALMRAGSVRLHMVETLHLSVPGAPSTLMLTINGLSTLTNQLSQARGEFTVHASPAGLSPDVTTIVDDGHVYLRTGASQDWVETTPGAKLASALARSGLSIHSGPLGLLGQLSSAGVRETGSGSVAGVATTDYAATLSGARLRSVLGALVPAGLAAAHVSFGSGLAVQVAIDHQGRARQLTVSGTITLNVAGHTLSIPLTLVATLSDFGAPVEVTAPPASQVRSLTAGSG